MVTLHVFFVVLALVLFVVAALNVNVPRVNLGWLGLFFWLLSTVVIR